MQGLQGALETQGTQEEPLTKTLKCDAAPGDLSLAKGNVHFMNCHERRREGRERGGGGGVWEKISS